MAYRDPDLGRLRDRERFARRTAKRVARGLCPRCGQTPPEPDHSLCEKCGETRCVDNESPALPTDEPEKENAEPDGPSTWT